MKWSKTTTLSLSGLTPTSHDLGTVVWDGEKFISAGKGGTILVGLPDTLIRVKVNGQSLKLQTPPVIVDDSSMLPVRDIFQAVGAEVSWDEATRTVTGQKGDTVVKLVLDAGTASVNGVSAPLDVPAQLVDGTTMAPARFVAEAFGYTVKWDDATRTFDMMQQ